MKRENITEKDFILGLCDSIRDYYVGIVKVQQDGLTFSFVGGQTFQIIAKEVF